MASIIGKTVAGRRYYYRVETARVDGRPRVVSQQYLGTADAIRAAVHGGTSTPERTSHLSFGDVAAVWSTLTDLDLAGLVDRVIGHRRADVSIGTYVALAVLHRAVAPGRPLDLATWWPGTAADRFVQPHLQPSQLDFRRMWRALERLTPADMEHIEAAVHGRLLRAFEPTAPVLVVDVPDFATYLDTGSRSSAGTDGDVRFVGLCLLVTLDGAVPLVSRTYQHSRAGEASLASLIEQLTVRHRSLSGTGDVTVVADAGHEARLGAGGVDRPYFVGPLSPSRHPALLASTARRPVDSRRLPGVTARDTRARVGGVDQRVLVVHSRNLQAAQERTLAQDLGHATRRLAGLAAALREGTWQGPREDLAAEVARTTGFRWSERVLSARLETTAEGPRLGWTVDEAAHARLRREVFGKQLLTTDHDDWSVRQVVTAYRAGYHLRSTLRHRTEAAVPAPSASWYWSDRRIAVHALISVLATTVTHLMRRTAQRAGLDLSARELLDQLSGIQETHMRYASSGGRPPTRRVLTTRDTTQQHLFELFNLDRYAPRG